MAFSRPMFRYIRLRFRERLAPVSADASLLLVHAPARGATLDVPEGWLSVSLPIAGQLHAEASDIRWKLERGRVLVWTGALQLRSSQGAGWLSLCGPPQAWRQAGADTAVIDDLLPDESSCSREQCRLFVRLARRLRTASPAEDTADLLDDLCASVHERQADLRALLPRCSGRTRKRQRHTLLRMLRIRHTIRTRSDENMDMESLARQVNYSIWHLARVYHNVFGHTPSEYAMRVRLERAMQLVQRTSMPFCEITEATGFVSQSSFCRSFKRFYGTTPSEARHGGRSSMHADVN